MAEPQWTHITLTIVLGNGHSRHCLSVIFCVSFNVCTCIVATPVGVSNGGSGSINSLLEEVRQIYHCTVEALQIKDTVHGISINIQSTMNLESIATLYM